MEKTQVFIVEDEFVVAMDLHRNLEQLGYAVCGRANSGEKAIQFVQHTRPHIILMDIMLKGEMTGIEAAAIIREQFHLPIVYVTANTNAHILEQAKITEPFGFIVKPFTERELHVNIEMALYKHRMEEQLRQSEARYRLLIESANDMIVVVQDGLVKLANPRTTELTGYAHAELLANPFSRFLHPEDQTIVTARYQQRQQGAPGPETYPVRIIRKDRMIRWFEVRPVVIEWEGRPATLTFMNDITERRQAEQALAEQKALLDEVFNGIQEGIALVDEFFTIVFCNPAYTKIVEDLHSDIVGRNVFSFFEAPERSFLIKETNIRRKGIISTYELPLVTMQGTRKAVQFTVAPRFGSDGSLIGEFVTLLDITQRKKAEDELRTYKTHLEKLVEQRTTELRHSNTLLTQEIDERKRAERALSEQSRFLEEVINGIQEGIGIVDGQETITFCNPGYAAIFGEDREHLIGENLRAFFDNEAWEIILQQTAQRKTGKTSTYELQLTTRPGKKKYIQATVSPRFNDDGGYSGALAVVLDVTERKQNEIALQQAKQAAEAGNHAKSEFLAHMSHELRTPLNGILGYAQLLQRDPKLIAEHREYAAIIQRSGDHLLTLLNDILDLSKLETGKFHLDTMEFNLSKAIQSVVEIAHWQAEQKELAFVYQVESGLPYAMSGDERRLRQVLLNLLGNAVKFTEKGTVTFRVSSIVNYQLSIDNCQLRFEVEDTGPGIPPEQLNRIFMPFEQGSQQRLYSEGAGLGLSLSQRILRLMGSELHVQSTVGQGSLFWFDLTLPESDSADMAEGLPVEWVSGHSQENGAPSMAQPAEVEQPLIPLPPQEVTQLYELALIGDIMGLSDRIEELAQGAPPYTLFLARLRKLAKDLRISAIQDFLRQYLPERPEE
jgi:PAS domain S-box-containing protein